MVLQVVANARQVLDDSTVVCNRASSESFM